MKHSPSIGQENSLEGRMASDIQVGFQIFAAHWRKVNPQWSYPAHTHPMFEINVVLEGEQSMLVDGQPYIQKTGDILFIRPDVPHQSYGSGSAKPMTYFCLHFDIDQLTLRRSLLNIAANGFMHDSENAFLVRGALDGIITSTIIAENDIHKERLKTLHDSLQLLAAISGLAISSHADSHILHPEASENTVALANQLERYLRETIHSSGSPNLEKREGIEEIAAHLGYSPAHCNRVFRQVFGYSPRQYLSSLIIREAKLLLMDNRISVEEVARRFGYRDVSYFSKQFKRWTGLSPLGFRKLGHES